MNKVENLLVTLSEECAELAMAVSKALRFGLDNYHPNNPETTNADDILTEYAHVTAMIGLLQLLSALPDYNEKKFSSDVSRKIENVRTWWKVSQESGTLQEGDE